MAFHFASENDHVVANDLSTFGLNVQAIWAESVQQYKAQMVRCLDTCTAKLWKVAQWQRLPIYFPITESVLLGRPVSECRSITKMHGT